MKLTVFDFEDYKDYLRKTIETRGRGTKSRLAAGIGCHVAYLSQVLNDLADFSPEQAIAASQALGHSPEEIEYFLLLVQFGRAGSDSLRKHLERKVKAFRSERGRLRNQLDFKKTLNRAEQATYYSAWYYAAIHVLITIPGFRTPESIAQRLGLPLEQASEALGFLESVGLAIRQKDGYRAGEVSLHLGDDSPMARLQLQNWRMRAIHALDRKDPRELRYSSIVSLSEKDLPKVRRILVEAIREVREVVRPSPEEVAYCYSLDLFQI